MAARDPARVAAELLVAQRPAFVRATGGEADHCILFTRIAVDVCRHRGVRARPLPVLVQMTADADPGVEILLGMEGQRPADAPDDFWDGHLVAILDGRLMVDLSIDSFARPELGLEPQPFLEEVPPEFVSGGTVELSVPGGQARYRALPGRKDYQSLAAWQPGTPEQVAGLAGALLWHPEHGI